MEAAAKVAGRSRSRTALASPTCQLTTWLPALSLVRMTASAPVGHTSKSTTEVPAGRLNSELDAGEGVTLSSAVVKSEDACAGEGACANADNARKGRLRNVANARFCVGFIGTSSGGTQAILEHAAPNSANRESRSRPAFPARPLARYSDRTVLNKQERRGSDLQFQRHADAATAPVMHQPRLSADHQMHRIASKLSGSEGTN